MSFNLSTRRVPGVLAMVLVAFGAATAQAQPMGAEDARFLLTRTGFAPTEVEVRALAPLSRAAAVERLLSGARAEALTPRPAFIAEPFERPRLQQMTDEERKAFQAREIRRGFELRSWWMTEMLTTTSPLTERMTLFLHNHFVSSLQKVRSAHLMYHQHLLLRRHALGNFGDLLHAVAKDPAMIVYLDAATNRRGAPNENFAREVMELFTLGEGNYTERDIKEAARAYTGWSIDPETGEFLWRPFAHDDGAKTLLGRNGNFDGDAVLDILLAQPTCAEFIVRKLWREFVSTGVPSPGDDSEIRRIAAQFRGARFDIKVALRGIFNSPRFHAPEHRAALVKSPVDLVVGTVRQMGIGYTDPLPFVIVASGLGQNLFAPPNVRGWPGGEAWINSSTLLGRKQFVERLFRVDEMRDMAGAIPVDAPGPMAMQTSTGPLRNGDFGQVKGGGRLGPDGRALFRQAAASIQFDGDRFFAQFAGRPHASIKQAMLPAEPANPLPAGLSEWQLLRALLLDPVYQLK